MPAAKIQSPRSKPAPPAAKTRSSAPPPPQTAFNPIWGRLTLSGIGSGPHLQRVVDPDYLVNEAHVGSSPTGAPARVFFPRDSSVIPSSEEPTIDAFKSGPNRTAPLLLYGLATEDEIAADRTLPFDRATAVDKALGTPQTAPPFHTKHDGMRRIWPGAVETTRNRPDLRFNRAVEILLPRQPTMSPGTSFAPPKTCDSTLEAAFDDAKTRAFDWIDATRPEVQKRPISGPIAINLTRFFGSQTESTAHLVDHNLGLIRAEIESIAQAGKHNCADPNLPECATGPIFNSGGTITICPGYDRREPEDRARNLIHEAGHSTAGLRLTGNRNTPRTSDFAYRSERLIHLLGVIDPDQALSNSDSYAMFLMTQRASAAITANLLPVSDPAASGFTRTADEHKVVRAVALAEVSIRLAWQGLSDLHRRLRQVGIGNPVPANLGDPRRMDRILAAVKLRFPPILSTPTIRSDDLLMIAGLLDRYAELDRLISQPIAKAPGPTTTLTVTMGSLALAVDAAFLAANERERVRTIVDQLEELVPTTRIRVAMRPSYGVFADLVRNLHQ